MAPPLQVCAAVRELVATGRSKMLDDERLDNLVKCLATADERKLLSAYAGPREALGAAEQLMLGLMGMPALEERLACARLVGSFGARMSGVRRVAETLDAACSEVRDSRLLLLILKMALSLGNFLNAGAHQGSALGFHLDTLLKLKDVRSTTNKHVTLMHFVARCARGPFCIASRPISCISSSNSSDRSRVCLP